jgi:DNA-binding PadR family transcriptional regulator
MKSERNLRLILDVLTVEPMLTYDIQKALDESTEDWEKMYENETEYALEQAVERGFAVKGGREEDPTYSRIYSVDPIRPTSVGEA